MKNCKHPTLKLFLIIIAAALVVGAGSALTIKLVKKAEKKEKQIGIAALPAIGEQDSTESKESAKSKEPSLNTNVVTTKDYSPVAENVMPAVVSIDCKIVTTYQNFFGGKYKQESTSSGTGFIVGQSSEEILIATNNHVIENANDIKITFVDGKSAAATVKGSDEAYDLAIVSVKNEDIDSSTANAAKIAVLGDSSIMQTGDIAIAIGNSLGYGQSLTVGYISAIDREVTFEDTTMKLIQTDAAINPGNNGGPLLNAYGEVIGINSVKKAGQTVEGIGYAIPVSKVIPIINELMNRKELKSYEVGYLGITGKNIEKSYASGFNKPMGVYVYSVDEGSPAEEAGIVFGDIITSVNGREVTKMEEIQKLLSYSKVGTEFKIVLQRLEDGVYKEIECTAILGRRK